MSGPKVDFAGLDREYESKMLSADIDCNEGKGHPEACHHVGEYLAVVKNLHKQAFDTYDKNCNQQKFGPSCFNAAKLLLGGKGVGQDDHQAARYFNLACKQKHRPACYHEGMLLYSSEIPDNQDPNGPFTITRKQRAAMSILEKNCEDGDSDSCHTIGSIYIQNMAKAADRDPVKALKYFTMACEKNNNAKSCYNAAVMYKKGDGPVKPDPKLYEQFKEKTSRLYKTGFAVGGGLKVA